MLTKFDRTVFESIVEKIIVGGINTDGEIDPAMLTIIFKTGDTQNKNGKKFKSKRKNAKLESNKLCYQDSDEDKKLYPHEVDNKLDNRGGLVDWFLQVNLFSLSFGDVPKKLKLQYYCKY